MVLAGLIVTFLGMLISLFSLSIGAGIGARLVIVLCGIAVSLFGIIGLINKTYVKNAIWRK